MDTLQKKRTSLYELDTVDWKILHDLQMDGRLSCAELGRRSKLSKPAIRRRVARMEKAGIITGYRAHVNPKRLGMPFTAIILQAVAHDQVKQLTTVVKNWIEISECYIVEGEASTFFMKAHLTSMEQLENLVDRLAPYGTPNASVVLSSPVEDRAIERPRRE